MIFVDLSNPFVVLISVILLLCVIILGKETKNSVFSAIALFAFLGLLIVHAVEILTLNEQTELLRSSLSNCITMDFIFIFLSYVSYLWIDDIETKFKNKKSIDNSLDWFWNKI